MDEQDQATATLLEETINAFFEEVDPDDFEYEDLAWALVRALKQNPTRPAPSN